MRIIYLHQYFNTPLQAGGTRSYEMARRLVANGHEVHMITSDRSISVVQANAWRQTVEDGIRVYWLSVPYSNHIPFKERIKAFLRFAWGAALKAVSLKGDVVFATSTPLTIAIPGILASWRLRIPMVFEVRDLWPEIPIALGAIKGMIPKALANGLEWFAYKNSAAIVALSPGMRDGIVRKGYPVNKVHVIPNSADVELFSVSPEFGRRFRMNHEWLKDRPLVVYAGTLGLVNGLTYMVRLATAAAKIAPEVRFLVIGEGSEDEKVRQEAERLGVLGRNFFMLKPLPKADMPMVLSAADIATSFVIDLPELWANSANKFFDALASGTPVAINYQGWQADLLRDSGSGIVLSATDVSQAAIRLIEFLCDEQRMKKAATAASRLAHKEFSRDLMAERLEAVLQRVARVRR